MDMFGNAGEWCADFYAPWTATCSGCAVDPTGPLEGTQHVVRGGDAPIDAADCLPDHRSQAPTATRLPTIGFRVLILP